MNTVLHRNDDEAMLSEKMAPRDEQAFYRAYDASFTDEAKRDGDAGMPVFFKRDLQAMFKAGLRAERRRMIRALGLTEEKP